MKNKVLLIGSEEQGFVLEIEDELLGCKDVVSLSYKNAVKLLGLLSKKIKHATKK